MGGYGGNNDGFGGGFGGLIAGALLGGGLFGNRDRDGRRDGGENCVTPAQFIAGLNNVSDQVSTTAILGKLGSIEAAIPLGAAQTENVILQQTNAINLGLGAVKDTVQNFGLVTVQRFAETNAAMAAGFAATNELINRLNTDNISRDLTVAQLDLREERGFRRDRETEINVTQTVNQVQAQAQAQAQFQGLSNLLTHALNDIQAVKQGQTIFNSGTMAASGTQAAANTKVN